MIVERKMMGTANKTAPPGQVLFTSSTSWLVPANVTSICAVAVGGGGGGADGLTYEDYNVYGSGAGGGGGALAYANNISVTPGETLTIIVGAGGPPVGNHYTSPIPTGGYSGVLRGATALVKANGGTCASGIYVVDEVVTYSVAGAGGTVAVGTGGSGGVGGSGAGGGGGAGGYAGDGGAGSSPYGTGGNGAGGAGGGGGGGAYFFPPYDLYVGAAGGGGVDVLGQGSNGVGGASAANVGSYGGGGGSGGDTAYDSAGLETTEGGYYGGGGGGGGGYTGYGTPGSYGAQGVVRIIWGSGRAFPSTNTQDV